MIVARAAVTGVSKRGVNKKELLTNTQSMKQMSKTIGVPGIAQIGTQKYQLRIQRTPLTKVASILSITDSTASAVTTAVAEEPVAIILSADSSQVDNLDRSPPASGHKRTPALANHATAGREERCREGVEGSNGASGPQPAKRSRQEDTTTRTLHALPSRGLPAQHNNRSLEPSQIQPTSF